ncbi:hypothetical protein MMC14_009963 [Varicellaria rhodocarpa]|nr:hypothetical protein [Varicellaria rhodocarpa]
MQSFTSASIAGSQELDKELQHIVTQLERQADPQTWGPETVEVFATADNWQTTRYKYAAAYASLLAWCAAFGYPCGLQLLSQQPEHLATTCNILHALLLQRQRDVSQRSQFDDHFQRMRSDLNVSEQTRDRLRSQLDAKQREHGTLYNQDMQAEKLKEQLRNMLMERKREAKKAFDMAGAWSKDTASRPAGRLAKRSNDSTIKAWSHHE